MVSWIPFGFEGLYFVDPKLYEVEEGYNKNSGIVVVGLGKF